ncbi:hypothetical protein [Candidatus Accumulibacter contiguus]|jgi:hypothetical protein|uniref:hypothetical protein n=1 Tax=Candidatus Accumulibacter contiguus TaxID=2954381 RepID=UPI002FC335CE
MITTDARTGASAPVDGRITWRFEIALLAQHAERLRQTSPITWKRILECLPVCSERAMRPLELNQILPDVDLRTLSSYLSMMVARGKIQRIGRPNQSRYYRES